MATSSKKMMAGFFFTSVFIGTMLLIGGKQGVFALGSLIINIVLLLLLLLLYQNRRYFSLKYSNLICRYRDNR